MPRAPRTPRNHDWRQPDSWPVKDGHIKHLAELTILELKKVLTFAARKFDPVAKSVIVTANKKADEWSAEAAGKAIVTSYIDERQYRQYKLKFESYIKEKAIEDAVEDSDFKTVHDSLEAAANKYKAVASAVVDKVVDGLIEDLTGKRVDFTPRERNICDQLNLPCRSYPRSLYHVKEYEAIQIVDQELKIIRQKCSRRSLAETKCNALRALTNIIRALVRRDRHNPIARKIQRQYGIEGNLVEASMLHVIGQLQKGETDYMIKRDRNLLRDWHDLYYNTKEDLFVQLPKFAAWMDPEFCDQMDFHTVNSAEATEKRSGEAKESSEEEEETRLTRLSH